MESVILDSSVWIAIERNDMEPRQYLSRGYQLLMPAMVWAELKYASIGSQRDLTKRQTAFDFLARVENLTDFVPMDRVVAEHYAELNEFCIGQGKPRAVSDLLIAATARAHNAALISYDKRARFGELPNLRIIG